MEENFDHPRDLVSAALELLSHKEFQRIDGVFTWKEEKWKYSIYKVPGVVSLIRLDMRKAGE